jgi:NADPH-dependent glutamate synthase beta subunit-like oxidoreductase
MIRVGVPYSKLEKWMIDRRGALLEEEGISFEYGVDVGRSVSVAELRERHDAVVVAIGSRVHRAIALVRRGSPLVLAWGSSWPCIFSPGRLSVPSPNPRSIPTR